MPFSTHWLPALPDVGTRIWYPPEPAGDTPLLVAELSPELLRRQVDALLEAGERLRRREIESIVRAVGAVAARFLDRGDSIRLEALDLIPAVTGMSPQMAELVVERMAADWLPEPLDRLLVAEFGDPAVLDTFATVGDRRIHAVGPDLLFHMFSGNVPGVAVTSLVRALLVKSPSLGKCASGEPVLPVLFARALAEEDEELGSAVAVAYWPGGELGLEEVAMERAECIVAYGSASTIRALRDRAPARARLVEHGSRVSLGLVGREALTSEGAPALARDAALAVGTFDQQGCVSPHLLYVEAGGEVGVEAWAAMVAEALRELEVEIPRGAITAAEASEIQQLRGRAEIRALAEPGNRLYVPADGTSWTVILSRDPSFEASCLQRMIWVKPLADLADVAALVAPLGEQLQTVGVAGDPKRLRDVAGALARLGATRIAPISEMAWPPASWHHDGRPPLLELVRFCDWD